MPADPRLIRLLGGPDTAWLLARARRRLERGHPLTGSVTHSGPTDAERAAVARLLGRPSRTGTALTVRWEAVDDVLRRSGAHPSGLADAVTVLGGPLRDLPAEVARQTAAWQAAMAPLDAVVDECPELSEWAERLRRSGAVRRLVGTPEDAGLLVGRLATVLRELPAPGDQIGRFAERLLGDAHGLDADRPLTTLVLGAARCLGGLPGGSGSTWRREVWAAVGLLVDDLSATVLTLRLPGHALSPTGRALEQLGAAGQPAVVTLRQLATGGRWYGDVDDLVVSVCENPFVVGLAADRLGADSSPLVCAGGQPGAAAVRLLRDLAAAGARLRYHGDFDWGGIRIGNFLTGRFPLTPWRFDAASYLAEVRPTGRPLTGTPVDAAWDPALREAMTAHGHTVEEERVADALVADLDSRRTREIPSPLTSDHADARS